MSCAGVLPFLESAVGLVCPADRDYADYIVEYLTDPQGTLRRQLDLLKRVEALAGQLHDSVFDESERTRARSTDRYDAVLLSGVNVVRSMEKTSHLLARCQVSSYSVLGAVKHPWLHAR